MCAASSSLPVPDSPMQQHARVGARHQRRLLDGALERRARSDHPRPVADQLAEALVLLRRRRLLERVLDNDQQPWSRLSGFSRKSKAPARVASTASAIVPWPEIMITGARSSLCRKRTQQIDAVAVRQPDVQQVRVRALRRPAERGIRAAEWQISTA